MTAEVWLWLVDIGRDIQRSWNSGEGRWEKLPGSSVPSTHEVLDEEDRKERFVGEVGVQSIEFEGIITAAKEPGSGFEEVQFCLGSFVDPIVESFERFFVDSMQIQ